MISKILKTYLIKEKCSVPPDIQWRTSDSKENSILFYKFNKHDDVESKLFNERIRSTKFKLCITNSKIKSSGSIYNFNDKEYFELQEKLLNEIYPYNKQLKFLGVTGTNGKTTTVDLVRQVAVLKNHSILTFGTLGFYKNEKKISNYSLTSPSYIDLRKAIYANMSGVRCIAMELSSIGLDQGRTGSIKFDAIGWTNFTQDHLDYHKTMELYFAAKGKVKEILKDPSDLYLPEGQVNLRSRLNDYKIPQPLRTNDNLFFDISYNRENLELALALLNVDLSRNEINKLVAPDGRFNIQQVDSSYIIIDYAHTPDAIINICSEIKKSFKGYKLNVVFGCGGNRDKLKRPLMGKAVSEFADNAIVTTDNPRDEKPIDIIDSIVKGINGSYTVEENREKAIKLGFAMQEANSILLIAGKGHENYMEVQGQRIPFSDEQIIKDLING